MVGSSASLSWDYLKEAVLHIEGTCVPIRDPDRKKKKALWVDKKAMKAIKHKNKVYSRYKNADHPAYVEAARLARLGMKTARKNFEVKLARDVKENVKSFYAYVRSKSKSRVRPVINTSGVLSTTDTKMGETFNEYFSSVFTVENCVVMPTPRDIFIGRDSEKLTNIDINQTMVDQKLAGLRSNKATGADDLNPAY